MFDNCVEISFQFATEQIMTTSMHIVRRFPVLRYPQSDAESGNKLGSYTLAYKTNRRRHVDRLQSIRWLEGVYYQRSLTRLFCT